MADPTLPAGYDRAAVPLLLEVESSLPASVSASDVVVRLGCYYYLSDAEPGRSAERTLTQVYCIG